MTNLDTVFQGLNVIEELPKKGIKLSYLIKEFVPKHGGRAAFQGQSNFAVVKKIMIPATEICKTSYCDMIDQEESKTNGGNKNEQSIKKNLSCNGKNVGEPEVFISHSSTLLFLDTLDALENHFEENLDVIIWFGVFSINHHKASTQISESLKTSLRDAIETIGHTVIVLSPSHNPTPYSRAWCVLEAYYTLKSRSRFEITMSKSEQQGFIDSAILNPNEIIETSMFREINSEKSTSFLKEDQDFIHGIIQQEIGCLKLNAILLAHLRKWATEIAKKEILLNLDERRRSSLLNLLGELHRAQDNHEAAQPLLEEALELNRALLGPSHPTTLIALKSLGKLHVEQGNYVAAQPLYEEVLEMSEIVNGPDHPHTLVYMNCLAGILDKQGNYIAAQPMHEKLLEKSKSIFGPLHPDTLRYLNNLGLVLFNRGNYDAALPLYNEVLEKRKNVLGSPHPDTLVTMINLGVLHEDQGNYDEALQLYSECLEKSKAVLGPDHPDTLTCMIGLGLFHFKQDNLEAALQILQICAEKCKDILGSNHPDTISLLGWIYMIQLRYHSEIH